MKHLFSHFSVIGLLALLALMSACSLPGQSQAPTSSQAGSQSAASSTLTPTPSPVVRLGVLPCPDTAKAPTYWNTYVHLNTAVGDHVGKVSCANLQGNPSLQALVTVDCSCSGGFMDLHLFTDITGTPKEIFSLQHLEKGDTAISNYNTIMTAEVDEKSSANKNAQNNASLTPDLYREFKWSENAGALVQVAFPGLFPDVTRFQAELDQQQVNQGHQPWKLDAQMTAQAFATGLLKWSPNAQTKLVSGGGTHDAEAVVEVRNSGALNQDPLTVTMDRLEGNTNGGIWIVAAAQSQGEQINTPSASTSVQNPANVAGNSIGSNGMAGTVRVLDHLYTNIGEKQAIATSTTPGSNPFSVSVPYTSSYASGQEEGIILIYVAVNFDGSLVHPAFVKVLLGGK